MVEQPEGAPRPQEERAVLILFDEMTYCSFRHDMPSPPLQRTLRFTTSVAGRDREEAILDWAR